MASDVVARIRAKLSRRRHSFTTGTSFASSRSATSSLKSQSHSHGNSQSRSQTPSQQLPSQNHHDLSSISDSSSATTTTTTTSNGDEKQHVSRGGDERNTAPATGKVNHGKVQREWSRNQRDDDDGGGDDKDSAVNAGTGGAGVVDKGPNSAEGGTETGFGTAKLSDPPKLSDPQSPLTSQSQQTTEPSTTAPSSTSVTTPTSTAPASTSPASQKPTPPPLPRQNSWTFRDQPLQSIDETSAPPSPATKAPAAVAGADPNISSKIADSVVATHTKNKDDKSNNKKDAENQSDDSQEGPRPSTQRTRSNKPLKVTLTEPPNPASAVQTPLVSTPTTHYFQVQAPPRRQSLLSNRQSSLIKTLLDSQAVTDDEDDTDSASILPGTDIEAAMVSRKIWVKRPGASATLITIQEDDLVDDVRDFILRKYQNSLGKTFDSPDLTLRILPREQSHKERLLGPEEPMCRTLDAYFPGGQSVGEALIIDIPARRTPRPSPRAHNTLYPVDDGRPPENGEGYFPPVTVGGMPSPLHGVAAQPPVTAGGVGHSIAVLGTGQIPPIPSPGATRPRHHRERTDRPRPGRQHTSSPTTISNGAHVAQSVAAGAADPSIHGLSYVARPSHSRAHSNSSDQQKALALAAPALPGSPGVPSAQLARVATPPPRVTSPRLSSTKARRPKRSSEYPSLSPGMLNGSVPPISVLIVEDNPINLKLLEAFVKKLKVRWSTAMNGRDAVKKWRSGGFHLVLMDIQLPVMNGLDATREIRRLERVNSIGVFTSSPNSLPEEVDEDLELKDGDRLQDMSLFKSPVIIVALTASSLQSDRHEALAAGCNDFLTKVCD